MSQHHPWAHPATPPGQADHYRFAASQRGKARPVYADVTAPPVPTTAPPPGVPAAWWADLAATFSAAELADLAAVAAECARVAGEMGL